MKKRFIPLIVILAVIAYGSYELRKGKNGKPEPLSGTVEAVEVTVAAEVAGRVLELGANEGDTVEAGRVIARLDSSTLEAQLRQAEGAKIAATGQYRAVDAGIRNADANVSRSQNLFGAGSISEQQFDTVDTQQKVLLAQRQAASGQIRQAEATAEYVKTLIGKATISAPITGTVLRRDIELGEIATPGASLYSIADLAKPWVRVYIPEDRLGHVKIGQTAKVTSDSYAGKSYPGTVVAIAGQAEFTPKNVQTREERVRLVYAVKVSLENPEGELKIGMPVDVALWD
ncbi:MAG: efflux RND transporter periplasmic adaptor subunit [Deltaproteobacteria bacterium]|nr:efflux RND transporter periplasmic adaptor subunit [Deltaproteobacteria bacterium]